MNLKIPGKDVGKLEGNVIVDTEELNRKEARKGWWGLKGDTEAVTGIDDGAIQPKEGR